MEKITITASKTYDVITDSGLLSQAGAQFRETLGSKAKKICIVTDHHVNILYGEKLESSLAEAGFDTIKFVFPAGEASKSLKTFSDLLEFLAENQLTRSDALAALGGGVTGDLTGFAAASFLRGIPFIQLPTTLLAAVDSSVGGKTGVNLKAGKNLAGAFWQPSLVLFDLDTIKSLSRDLLLDGMAETIKAGAIADQDLLSYIARIEDLTAPETIRHLSNRAIIIKREVVQADERDTGVRQLLNFGHTIGHAIEKCSGFTISHGHAVAIGMLIAARGSQKMGWSEEDCGPLLENILKRFSYPLDCPYSVSQLMAAALNDKKRQGDIITLVIPTRPGKCQLKKISINQLEKFIKAGLR